MKPNEIFALQLILKNEINRLVDKRLSEFGFNLAPDHSKVPKGDFQKLEVSKFNEKLKKKGI